MFFYRAPTLQTGWLMYFFVSEKVKLQYLETLRACSCRFESRRRNETTYAFSGGLMAIQPSSPRFTECVVIYSAQHHPPQLRLLLCSIQPRKTKRNTAKSCTDRKGWFLRRRLPDERWQHRRSPQTGDRSHRNLCRWRIQHWKICI